jgi:hypothetical protein
MPGSSKTDDHFFTSLLSLALNASQYSSQNNGERRDIVDQQRSPSYESFIIFNGNSTGDGGFCIDCFYPLTKKLMKILCAFAS